MISNQSISWKVYQIYMTFSNDKFFITETSLYQYSPKLLGHNLLNYAKLFCGNVSLYTDLLRNANESDVMFIA